MRNHSSGPSNGAQKAKTVHTSCMPPLCGLARMLILAPMKKVTGVRMIAPIPTAATTAGT